MEEHDIQLAESARNVLKQDQERLSSNLSHYFPVPKITTSVAYYKCNM